jgi:hypothetical protein
MYQNLGIHWASTVPAFLSLICVPMPVSTLYRNLYVLPLTRDPQFLFYKFGPKIREKCKFAAESAAFMQKMRQSQQ